MYLKNVKFHGIAYDGDKWLGSKFFCSEQAMSKWANKFYRTNENVTVYIYEGMSDRLYCTYHA